ncbi:phosphoenolpyruvate carboxylase, partial [Escherichia coli]|nr:phosphoenolpyruvate carboxylase [Escherichia coli]
QDWQPSAETQEVFETCRVIAKAKNDSIAAYVISMAKVPSDVLAVKLLLKENGASVRLPVAPLFETLEDLNNAESVMTKLLSIEWYRDLIDDR